MLQPYDLPHACETHELTQLLGRLDARRLRVLRSYVWQVEVGDKDLTAWLAMEQCPTSRAAWYRQGGRNYLGDPDFARALEIYKLRALAWQMGEEVKAVRQAQNELRTKSLAAARKLVDLLYSSDERVQLDAAKTVLDRAGVETASKQQTQVTGSEREPLRVLIAYDNVDDTLAPAPPGPTAGNP